ncbi:hypothetical protein UFOVP92_48 [uncultured Caudovirales phage]|uniref:Uncharacterized protein n=1 Tax=uncultured Caudovirales phage TaxID=2100421 RepID=A0A6J5KZT3_9CAUD|nr:hypothetical protein UFOVP92_48 [uncultured Caudovirales phage]
MNTIDNIMALADEYAESYRDALAPNVNALVDEAKTALRTALTETLVAQPVRDPLAPEHIERIYQRYGGCMINCTRAIERAHGIGGDK